MDMNKINYAYWKDKKICTFDVDGFIDKVFQKYQQMAQKDIIAPNLAKKREELRNLWDKVMGMSIKGDSSLYPNKEGSQPELMEVWGKAGDFWCAGYRSGDLLLCDQYDFPLRKWMIRAIKAAKGEMMELYNFVAIDFETATSKRSSICEIGIAVVRNNGEVTETKSWLVQPPGNEYDIQNIMIHNITPNDTQNSPTFAEVWPEVLPYIEGQLVVAHNTSFDMYALRDALDKFNLTYPTFIHICSCRLARKLLPGLYNYRLPTVSKAIGFPMQIHHRAGVDAEAAAMVYIACLDKQDSQTIEELQNHFSFRCGKFADGTFIPQKAKSKGGNVQPGSIFGNPASVDEGNYFYGKEVCFTGACSFGTRNEMMQMVADIGGTPTNNVTKKTQVLVVGQQDYCIVGESGLSGKQKKAIELFEKGQDIEIFSEIEFLQMI